MSYDSEAFVEYQSHCIEDHMKIMFSTLAQYPKGSAQLHRDTFKGKHLQWAPLKTNTTCLFCLRRNPEHVLSCGHAVCDDCVRIFGDALPGLEYHYHISNCVLCHSGTLTVRLKPPTAGYRILSVDGGGTRGVVPLEFLGLIQDLIGDCPVQDLFDGAWGTSSGTYTCPSAFTTADVPLGGLIVLCLFLLGWDVPRCIREFDTLARQFFTKGQKESQSLLGYLSRVFKCWLSDGCYDVSTLEVTLKSCFGLSRRMFDTPATISGIKVGVTASAISDASTFVFSNYNGLGTRAKGCGTEIRIIEASTGFFANVA